MSISYDVILRRYSEFKETLSVSINAVLNIAVYPKGFINHTNEGIVIFNLKEIFPDIFIYKISEYRLIKLNKMK